MDQLPLLLHRRALSPFLCSSCLRRALPGPSRSLSLYHQPPSSPHRPYSTPSTTPSHDIDDDSIQPIQAHPLTGYYSDLLSSPTPARPYPKAPPKPPTKNLSTEEKARMVFGWQEGGPYKKSPRYNPASYTSSSTAQTRMGVPPRPAEPDNCCMSGCAHCVWDDYRDDVEVWAERVRKANLKARGQGGGSMDDDGGGSETNWTEGADGGKGGGELFKGIPVGIREFMRTEKRLKERQERRA